MSGLALAAGTAKRTLGNAAVVPLADARELARAELRKVAAGLDPRQERRAREDAVERQRRNTVAAAVELWLAKDQAGNRTADEVRKTMAKHVLPVWGNMPLADLSKRNVLELLDRVGQGAPVRVNRVLAYVKRFLSWCAARDLIDASPAAAVEKPARETRRERLLDDREIIAVWQAAKTIGGPFGTGVRLLLCTGARREEIFGTRRDELSVEGDAIRVPAERSKTGQGRVIWLNGLSVPTRNISLNKRRDKLLRFGGRHIERMVEGAMDDYGQPASPQPSASSMGTENGATPHG